MNARIVTAELMDDPAIDPADHRAALRGLARLNRLGAVRALEHHLRDLFDARRPLRVLDIATGSADVPIALTRRAHRRGTPLHITACDISATALDVARRNAADASVDLELLQLNVLRDAIPTGFDVVTCSLFLHHLLDDHAAELLGRMAAAAERRVVVSDIARSRFNTAVIALCSRLVTRSRVVHVDALRSAAAAFTTDEARRLAGRAGLGDASVVPRFPARFVLVWNRRA